eukprot:Gb_26779 [translate_table: standard]
MLHSLLGGMLFACTVYESPKMKANQLQLLVIQTLASINFLLSLVEAFTTDQIISADSINTSAMAWSSCTFGILLPRPMLFLMLKTYAVISIHGFERAISQVEEGPYIEFVQGNDQVGEYNLRKRMYILWMSGALCPGNLSLTREAIPHNFFLPNHQVTWKVTMLQEIAN